MNPLIIALWSRRLTLWVVGAVFGVISVGVHAQSREASTGAREQRIALVIGNSDYSKAPLKNPVNDANDVAAALGRLGFQVTLRTNVNRVQMRTAVRDFGLALRRGGVGLFFYAGHGVESKGKNFLIPLGANLGSEFELEDEALDANSVLRAMEEAGNPTNIMIMDACRDNPFARSWRSASRGLAQMNAPSGSFIAFATAPGSVAADGDGRNSPFTKNLLASLSQPDLDIDRVFTRVTAAVARDTARQQVPWKSSSLTGAFSFSGDLSVAALSPAPTPAPAPAPVAAVDPTVNDRVFWESVKDSRNPEELRAYLAQFPRGLFAPLASTRLRSLQASEAASVAAVRPPPDPAASLSAQDAYQQGRKLIDSSNPNRNDAEAVRLFRWAADRGLAGAQRSLGVMYEFGQGVANDDAEAVRLYRLAANQGDEVAQTNLGYMYENGRGVARNDVEAVRLYRLAVNQGLARAQVNLGFMHENGRGVAKDEVEAVRLYRLAANQGDTTGQANLGFMYESGRGVTRDDVEAIRLYRLAANQGFARAQNNLGVMHEQGRSVTKDFVEAVRLYRLAANQGHVRAQINLGLMYEHGRGVTKDLVESARLYKLAADQGNATGQNNLGVMYETGRGVAKNEAEAVRLYQLSAKQGNASGQYNLGDMYERGLGGFSRELSTAKSWYRLAARQGHEAAQTALKRLGETW
jgi:TPR repeat protein